VYVCVYLREIGQAGIVDTLLLHRHVQVEVVGGTYNLSEPLVDWTWYIVDEDPRHPLSRYRLIDLEPQSFYELQVIAVNELGRSDVDARFIFSTAAAVGE